jgi:hypothetical protein
MRHQASTKVLMTVKPNSEHIERFTLGPLCPAPNGSRGIDPTIIIGDLCTKTETVVIWMGIELVDHIEARLAGGSMWMVLIINGRYVVQPIILKIRLVPQERQNVADATLMTDNRCLSHRINDLKDLVLETFQKLPDCRMI